MSEFLLLTQCRLSNARSSYEYNKEKKMRKKEKKGEWKEAETTLRKVIISVLNSKFKLLEI